MIVSKPKTAHAARQDGDWQAICQEVAGLRSLAALEAWRADFVLRRLSASPDWQEELWELLEDRVGELRAEALMRTMDRQFQGAMERDQ